MSSRHRQTQRLITLILWVVFCLQVVAQPDEVTDAPPSGVALDSVSFEQQVIHYAYAGNPDAPGLLFIHGTPGSWQAFAAYLTDRQLQRGFFMLSVDRPGWGRSILNTDAESERKSRIKEVVRFSYQADVLALVMRQFPNKQWLLVGHSLGASIAPKVALLYPGKVSGLLLLAGSLQPRLGAPRWYNRLASLWAIRWMLPGELRFSNDEIMALKSELTLLEAELSAQRLDIPVTLIQGLKDRLVSPKNAGYVKQHWARRFRDLTVEELPEAGHFLPWENAERVKAAILDFDG